MSSAWARTRAISCARWPVSITRTSICCWARSRRCTRSAPCRATFSQSRCLLPIRRKDIGRGTPWFDGRAANWFMFLIYFGRPGTFLLYAGRISPHKNIVRIIEAFAALKAELAKQDVYPDLKLIIIGDELSKHPDLRRTVVRGGVQNDVRFMGFVPIDVLRIFYDLAKVFVFPSLYDGFGLPSLEAMAHGTPVVTWNLSSLPEVGGYS